MGAPTANTDHAGADAADYLRVSKLKDGREKSPNDQHKSHIRTATRRTWNLTRTYRDVGSASKHARKSRSDFDRLMADLESGAFPAKILMLWEPSRGSRRESEWLKLIELADERGVIFWIEIMARILDPANPYDRKTLINAAADAAFETSILSGRSRRGIAEAAAEGLPHAHVPYGYKRLYDEETRDFIEQVKHPVEAPVVEELFTRVHKGHSMRSITRDFKARGIEKRSGGPFTQQHLRSMLNNPAYAGLRAHDPNRPGGQKLSKDAVLTDAVWPGIVGKRVFYGVHRLLSDPDRLKNTRPGAAVHLLAGIARCDVCGEALTRQRYRALERYRCVTNGCVTVDQPALDAIAEDVVLGFLTDPDAYARLRQNVDEADAELAKVADMLAAAQHELDELARQTAAGETSMAWAAKVVPGLEARIAQLRAQERDLVAPSILVGLIEPGVDAPARWRQAERSTQREILRRLFVPEWLGELRVRRVGPGRRRVPIEVVDRVAWKVAE
jgi:DNA invertase Pin-like site-specific DNA recombinase